MAGGITSVTHFVQRQRYQISPLGCESHSLGQLSHSLKPLMVKSCPPHSQNSKKTIAKVLKNSILQFYITFFIPFQKDQQKGEKQGGGGGMSYPLPTDCCFFFFVVSFFKSISKRHFLGISILINPAFLYGWCIEKLHIYLIIY